MARERTGHQRGLDSGLGRLRLWLHPAAQWVRGLGYRLVYAIAGRLRPLDAAKVVLATNRGHVLSDNLAQIERHLDRGRFSVTVFLLANASNSWGRWWMTLRFIWAMAQATYTVIDDYLPAVYPLRLREGARLIQAWHALGAFKKVGYSRGGRHGGPSQKSLSHKNYTDVIVSADRVRRDYAEAFCVPLSSISATGVPRTDLFFDQSAMDRARAELVERHLVLAGRRVILFAPTFRGRSRETAAYPSDYLDLNRIGESLAGDDLFVVRMHPFVQMPWQIPEAHRDRIIDLSDEPEFNHLLLVSDLLITDYSSAIFDYALLARPVVYYVPDLDQFAAQRGFYHRFSRYIYGPVARDMSQLLAAMDDPQLDDEARRQFYATFLNRCDGHATERVMRVIFGQGPPPTAAPSPQELVRRGRNLPPASLEALRADIDDVMKFDL